MIGPCTPYLTVDDLKALPDYCPPDPLPDGYDEVLEAFITRACEVMYVLTGRQFPGDCTVTRYPVARFGCDFHLPFERLIGGYHPTDDSIPLWYNPRDITVKIDGATFTDWYLRDGTWLVRADGKRWPTSNDLSLPNTEAGTFTVTWTFGPPTPLIVASAALELAHQFQMESMADARCKLPPLTTSLNRQGQTITIDRDVERTREAGPSLQSVMVAMSAFNTTNARTPPDVWSPDHLWELVAVGEDLYDDAPGS